MVQFSLSPETDHVGLNQTITELIFRLDSLTGTILFEISFSNCLKISIKYVSYVSWKTGSENSVISRSSLNRLDFTCIIQTSYKSSLENPIKPLAKTVDVNLGEIQGSVGVSLGLFENENFTTPKPKNAEIIVPEKLYVAASTDSTSEYNVVLNKCWATSR